MIERIRVHNHLNGTRFSTLEFGFASLAALLIALAFVLHGSWLPGVLAVGTAVNCFALTAVVIAGSVRSR